MHFLEELLLKNFDRITITPRIQSKYVKNYVFQYRPNLIFNSSAITFVK